MLRLPFARNGYVFLNFNVKRKKQRRNRAREDREGEREDELFLTGLFACFCYSLIDLVISESEVGIGLFLESSVACYASISL